MASTENVLRGLPGSFSRPARPSSCWSCTSPTSFSHAVRHSGLAEAVSAIPRRKAPGIYAAPLASPALPGRPCFFLVDGSRLRAFGASSPPAPGMYFSPHPGRQRAEYPGGRGFGGADRRPAGPCAASACPPMGCWPCWDFGCSPLSDSGAGHPQRQLSHKHLARQGPVQLGAAPQHHLEHRLSVRHLLRGMAVGFGGPVAVLWCLTALVGAAAPGQRAPHRRKRVSGLLGWVSSSFLPKGTA